MRRINFFGAPGTGKTVLAYETFAHFKKSDRNCELVTELAREWAYIDRSIQSMDQIYLFASQMNREDSILSRNKADFLITDSPLLLNCWFSRRQNPVFWQSLEPLVRLFDAKFPPVNFFCPINHSYRFDQEGRHFSKEESATFSESMLEFVTSFYGEDSVTILPNAGRIEAVISRLEKV